MLVFELSYQSQFPPEEVGNDDPEETYSTEYVIAEAQSEWSLLKNTFTGKSEATLGRSIWYYKAVF